MSIKTQWLFMISDTNSGDDGVLSELEKSVDGDNVAFIYNNSPASPPTCNVSLVTGNLLQEMNFRKRFQIICG